jgi:hypothetical protein
LAAFCLALAAFLDGAILRIQKFVKQFPFNGQHPQHRFCGCLALAQGLSGHAVSIRNIASADVYPCSGAY